MALLYTGSRIVIMQEIITKERLGYIKAHVRFLQRRREISVHPLDMPELWQMREGLNEIHNGAMAALGTNLCELCVLMHDLDGLLAYNVRDEDC